MFAQYFPVALMESQRAMRAMIEGAGPGSAHGPRPPRWEQPRPGRVATMRRAAGAAMIRAGESLRGTVPQTGTAYSR